MEELNCIFINGTTRTLLPPAEKLQNFFGVFFHFISGADNPKMLAYLVHQGRALAHGCCPPHGFKADTFAAQFSRQQVQGFSCIRPVSLPPVVDFATIISHKTTFIRMLFVASRLFVATPLFVLSFSRKGVVPLNKRLKKLRKALDLTQQEFANRIGVKRNTIATYEIGRNTPLDAVIASICREFSVLEAWLRTGEGEMFVKQTEDDELAMMFSAIAAFDDELIKRIIRAYWKLDDKEKAAVKKLIDGFTPVSSSAAVPVLAPAPQNTGGQERAAPDLAAKVADLERREELIGGKVVMMAPTSSNHNRIAGNIYYIFRRYLNGKKCEPFADGENVYLTDDDHFVDDFMVVCDPDKIKTDGVHGAPDLGWRSYPPAQRGMIRPTRKTCTPAAASGNTGSSTRKINPSMSTARTEPNLSFMIFTPCIPTGCLRRCPRKSGRRWRLIPTLYVD